MPRCPDHDVVEVLRQKLIGLEIPLIEGYGLRLGDVVHGPGWISEAPPDVVNVLDGTDNLIGSRILHGSGTEVLAHRILVPEKLLGKGFVDDGHVPRIPVVIFVDRASRQHSGADRIEEPWRYAGPVSGHIVLRARLWFALNPNVVAVLATAHRRIRRGTDAAHPGNGAEPVLNLTIKRDQLLLLMARQYGAVDGNQIAVLRIEPEVLVLQIAQAAAQHRRGAEQHQRHRHLRNHQRLLRPMTAASHLAIRATHRLHRLGVRVHPRGRDPEDHSGEHRDSKREEYDQNRRRGMHWNPGASL